MNQGGKTSTTRVSRRVTATERFKAQARKGRSRAVLWILLGIGGLFGVVVLCMFVGDGERPEVLEGQYQERIGAVRKVRSEGNLDGALKLLKETLKFVESHECLGRHRLEVKGMIKEVEGERANRAEVEREIATFERDFRKRAPQDLADLRRRGELLVKAAPGHAALGEMVATVLREIQQTQMDIEEGDFVRTKHRIHTECRLDGREPEWGRALSMWKAYQSRKTVTSENRARAEEEKKGLEGRARREFERLSQRESVEGLRKHRPRFDATAVAPDFDNFLKDRR